MDNPKQCPITSIRKIRIIDDIPTSFEFFYSDEVKDKYILSRENSHDFVVGLAAQFEAQCSNDYKYYDKYDNFFKYWNETLACGEEGRIPSDIYRPFDDMPTKKFLFNNDLWSASID